MARPLRVQAAGLMYHVTARGTGRMTIYIDDVDRWNFVELLADVAEWLGLIVHAYCLMANHYHLVITTTSPNLSKAVKSLNGRYAQQWNRRHERVGHMFQGRFGAQIVQEDAYFATVCRYVVLNPVRAGLAKRPEDWPWSSFRATVGLAPPPSFLRPAQLLARFDSADPARGAQRFRQFVAASSQGECLPAGRWLADERFVEQFERWLSRAGLEVPRREREAKPSLETIFAGAMTRACRARQMTEAHRIGYSMADIARYLGLHYATVSKATTATRAGSNRENSGEARPDPT